MTLAEQKRLARKQANIDANPPRMVIEAVTCHCCKGIGSVIRKVMSRNCVECGQMFIPKRSNSYHCSHNCMAAVGERRRRAEKRQQKEETLIDPNGCGDPECWPGCRNYPGKKPNA